MSIREQTLTLVNAKRGARKSTLAPVKTTLNFHHDQRYELSRNGRTKLLVVWRAHADVDLKLPTISVIHINFSRLTSASSTPALGRMYLRSALCGGLCRCGFVPSFVFD